MKDPRVSVIMPVYNRERYLPDTINSILGQTFTDFEFLIVDDGSTDNSAEVIKSFQSKDPRIRLLPNKEGKGIVAALHTAIKASRGEYIARMDSDDISLPERLEKEVFFLDTNSEIGACGAAVELFGNNQGITWKLPLENNSIKCTMLFCGAIANPTGMFRRSIFFDKNFWYDHSFLVAEDYDFWERISDSVKLANLPDTLLLYRIHSGSTGMVYSKEHMEGARRVRLRQIKKLGIQPTKEELEIHNKIGNSHYIRGKHAMEKVDKWLKKLTEANQKIKIYPEADFEAMINKKRLETNNIYNDYRQNFNLKFGIIVFSGFVGKIMRTFLPSDFVDNINKILVIFYLRLEKKKARILSKSDRYQIMLGLATKLKKKVRKEFKIGMAILAHERPEYLKLCLDTLFKTRLYDYDITFLIQDDGSTDPRVKDIINAPRDNKYKIVRSFTEKGHNSWAGAFNKAMRKLMRIDDFDIVGSCDSDALFHPEWLDKTMKICLWAKAHHKDHVLGPFSSFNSSDWKFHNILGTYMSPFGGYVVKERMGAVNYLYFKDDFLKLGFYPETVHDETLMTEKFKKMGIRYFSTEISYVEHIGENSILEQLRPIPVKKRPVYGMNLAKGDWGVDMEKISPYGYYKYLKESVGLGAEKEAKSDLEVDVVIPAIKKDLDILPLTVSSVRKFLKHPIGEIYVVGPKVKELESFCYRSGCIFRDEDTVLPIKIRDINYKVRGTDRSGWIFQQLLKIGVDKISDKKNFYVIDADTILVQPQKFEHEGRIILLAADEYNFPYFETFKKIFKYNPVTSFSFVAHQMLFSADKLKEFRDEIERKNDDKSWYQAILDNLDPNEMSSFSEYETYGNWMKRNHPENIIIEYWFNKSLSQKAENDLDYYSKKYGHNFCSVSLHSYCRNNWQKAVTLLK